MPFIAALLGGLATVMGSLVGRVLLALGIGFVSYTGISTGVDVIVDAIKGNMNNLGSEAIKFLSYLWVDKALSMIFSAFTIAMTFQLAGGTSIKKMVVK